MADNTVTPIRPTPPRGGRHYTVRWSDADGAAREHRCTVREDHVRFLMSLFDAGLVGSPEARRSRFVVVERKEPVL